MRPRGPRLLQSCDAVDPSNRRSHFEDRTPAQRLKTQRAGVQRHRVAAVHLPAFGTHFARDRVAVPAVLSELGAAHDAIVG